jgi:uncharacterized protein (TIGR02147 family)
MLIGHLKRTFADRCRANPAYSLRAFSRSMGMDSSTVSALLSGKRTLTIKTAKKIVNGLNIKDPNEAQALLVETFTSSPSGAEGDASYTELALDAAEAISGWQHFAILALLEIKTFNGHDRTIAERLNIPLGIVWECLQRLEKLGLAEKRRGSWVLTGKNMSTPDQVPSGALREGHRQNILKSIHSLQEDPVDIRDISGITMAVSSSRLEGGRKMIQEFRRRLSAYMEGGKRDAVYRLNIQLFPLTVEKKT